MDVVARHSRTRADTATPRYAKSPPLPFSVPRRWGDVSSEYFLASRMTSRVLALKVTLSLYPTVGRLLEIN